MKGEFGFHVGIYIQEARDARDGLDRLYYDGLTSVYVQYGLTGALVVGDYLHGMTLREVDVWEKYATRVLRNKLRKRNNNIRQWRDGEG